MLSTLPLPALIDLIQPPLPATVASMRAAEISQPEADYIALGARSSDYHWYLLDEHFRVNRMSEQKNVSSEMVPADRTVLCIELSCWRDEPGGGRQTGSTDRAERSDADGLRREGERGHRLLRDRHPTAYPVYELNFEDHLIPTLEGVHAVRTC